MAVKIPEINIQEYDGLKNKKGPLPGLIKRKTSC
jgi:hypothetical protein